MSRRLHVVEHGVLRIDQRTRVGRVAIGTDVSGPAVVYARARIHRGQVAYLHGDTRIDAPSCFEIWLPPFSVVQAELVRCDVVTTAFVFAPPAGVELPGTPVLVRATPVELPATRDQVLARLPAAGRGVSIPRDRQPAPIARDRRPAPIARDRQSVQVARDARAVLDEEYMAPSTIAGLAGRLGLSPAGLSRSFRKTFGLPPVRYRHQVRVMDALMRFAAGAAPVDVSLEVGFEDLSRFYKVFRRIACGPPGAYRSPRSRNAKTR